MPLQIQYVSYEDPARKQRLEGQKPTIITWKDAKMIRGHSLRAAVREILQIAEVRQVVKISIVGDQGTGKTTLSECLAHLCHTISEIPFAVKMFNKEDMFVFKETIDSLEPVNHILIFNDMSFMKANISKTKIEQIKQEMTTIRHIKGQDVKIILIYNYHYTLSLDKYLRQVDFRYFTNVGSSEFDNMVKQLGPQYSDMINQFTRLEKQAELTKKFTFRLSRTDPTKEFTYDYRKPFIPLLYWNGFGVRFVVSPKREWIDPICPVCTHIDNVVAASELDVNELKENMIRVFGESHTRLAVRLELYQNGYDVFPKRTKQAVKFLDAKIKNQDKKVFENLAACFDFKDERTRLDVKIPEEAPQQN